MIEAPPGAWTRPDALERPTLRVANHQGVAAVQVGPGKESVELPLRLRAGHYTPVLVAIATGDGFVPGEL